MALFKSSPYSFKESLKWLYYYFFPSTKKYTGLTQLPMNYGGKTDAGKLSISFIGDLMCLDNEAIAAPDRKMLETFKKSDLVVINLEAPLTREKIEKKSSLLVFSFSEEFIDSFLKAYELPREKVVFSIANNHIGDQEKDGLKQTVRRLEKMNIRYVGIRDHARNMPVVKIKGLNVGLAAYSDWLNCDVFDDRFGILRKEHVENIDFKELKIREGLDTVVLLNHWSYEFRHYPKSECTNMAKKLIDAGVDIIAGHHPHVLGPIEKIGDGICHYSLGNFFAKTLHWATRITGIWNVQINTSGPKRGKAAHYQFDPYYMKQTGQNFEMVQVDDLKSSLKGKVIRRLNDLYPEQ